MSATRARPSGAATAVKQLPSLQKSIAGCPRLTGDELVAVEDDLRGERRVPGHLDRDVSPLRIHDVERVVVHERLLLGEVPIAPPAVRVISHTVAGARAARIRNTPGCDRRGWRGIPPRSGACVHPCRSRSPARRAPAQGPDPAGEPARHPHQVVVVQLLVRTGQPSPPDPEPPGL